MVKIHGIIYILIGIFISIVSYLIDAQDLYIFYYGGMFFIAFGVAKIVLRFIAGGKEGQKDAKINQQKMQAHPVQSYKKCRRCGNVARLTDRFCPRCGTKMYVSMLF